MTSSTPTPEYIVITGPLPGEMPEDYCPVCEYALVMHTELCHVHDLCLTEVRMSDCKFGCKVYRCESCGDEMLQHSASYGCPLGRASHIVTAVAARDLMVEARAAVVAAFDAARKREPRGWEDVALTEALMNVDAALNHLSAVVSS